jgi:hypothetical protein
MWKLCIPGKLLTAWKFRTSQACGFSAACKVSAQMLGLGIFGPQTIKAMQWKLGVTTDGNFGPTSKKALQRNLHVTPDGIIEPETVKALQAHVGATQDGQWGPLTTEAMQRALNAGRF